MTEVYEMAEARSGAVIPQSAGVQGRRHKGVPQTVHGKQRRIAGRITMVIGKRRPGHCRAGFRFDRIDGNIFAVDFVIDIWKSQSGKIAAAPGASNDDIRIFPNFFHLLFGFKADDGLMQHDMIEHAA